MFPLVSSLPRTVRFGSKNTRLGASRLEGKVCGLWASSKAPGESLTFLGSASG